MTEPEDPPQDRRDLGIAAILVLLTSLLFLYTTQGRIYGNDGAMLADWFFSPQTAYQAYHNVLYLPVAHALAMVWPFGGSLGPLHLLSALATGLAIGAIYLCARTFVARRVACFFGAAMFALTPAVWFFATTIEVHALHLCVVSLCALVILKAPWQRPALALTLTAAVLPLTYLSHQSAPILGPGWVMLAQLARSRCARPFSMSALTGVGILYLGALIIGHLIANLMRGQGLGFDVGFVAGSVSFWRQSFGLDVVWEELISPYVFLVAVVPLVIWWRLVSRLEGLLIVAYLLPGVVFFLWWGITERGGYLLGPAVVVAILAARLAERGLIHHLGRLWIGLALAAQLVCGAVFVHRFDAAGFQLDDRIARIEEFLGGGGVVISANDNAPSAAIWLPEVREFNLRLSLTTASSVESWLVKTVPMIQFLVGTEPAILDTSYRERLDPSGMRSEYLDALEAALQRVFRVTKLADESWPMWLLSAR